MIEQNDRFEMTHLNKRPHCKRGRVKVIQVHLQRP